MKRGSGKGKGSQFERDVSLLLDEWWNVPKNTFWRTPNSGGWSEPGDISPRHSQNNDEKVFFPFIVECKFYKTIDFWELLKANKTQPLFLQWLDQIRREKKQAIDAGRSDKLVSLLIFKQNGGPICVAYDEMELLTVLLSTIYASAESLIDEFVISYERLALLRIPYLNRGFVVTRFADFTRVITKEFVYRFRDCKPSQGSASNKLSTSQRDDVIKKFPFFKTGDV